MALSRDDLRKKTVFRFLDELDHLVPHQLTSPEERSQFRRHVINQHALPVTSKGMDNFLRQYWRKCTKDTQRMTDSLFMYGSEAFPGAFLAGWGYFTWKSKNGIKKSTFIAADHDPAIAHNVSEHPPAKKRQKTSQTPATVQAQTRDLTVSSKDARSRSDSDIETSVLPSGLPSMLRSPDLAKAASPVGPRESSGPTSLNEHPVDGQQGDDHTAALNQEKTVETVQYDEIAFADDYMPRMAKSSVIASIDRVWSCTTSFIGAVYCGSQIDECNDFQLVIEPQNVLESLYKELLGLEWESNAFKLIHSKGCSPIDFMHGCLGAFITCLIFNDDLPWKGAKALTADHKHLESFFDQALTESGQQSNMKSLMARVAYRQVNTEDFQQTTLQELATKLYGRFMLAMCSQITLFKAGLAKEGSKFALHEEARSVKDAFFEALKLKGQLEATADEYSFCWIESGKEFDEEQMEDIGRGKHNRCVACCAFPRVVCKYEGDDSETLVARAKVYTMAKLT